MDALSSRDLHKSAKHAMKCNKAQCIKKHTVQWKHEKHKDKIRTRRRKGETEKCLLKPRELEKAA